MNLTNEYCTAENNDGAMNTRSELDTSAIESLQYLCNWAAIIEELRLRMLLEKSDSK